MPIKKFRSLDDIRKALRVEPGTLEHSYALRSVFWMADRFAPKQQLPPGVYKYRSIEEARAQRTTWEQFGR
ncbi:MAG: hypothetical protein DMG05_18845 [Acidobacteria bacterium]|nr:MAG: hypothetical protein DMG05_18845 [Acidobacteriota bacterium]